MTDAQLAAGLIPLMLEGAARLRVEVASSSEMRDRIFSDYVRPAFLRALKEPGMLQAATAWAESLEATAAEYSRMAVQVRDVLRASGADTPVQ